MLDVAAVAERLLQPFGFKESLNDALTVLIALHDIGKISANFRSMILDGTPQAFRH
jgi:CRISPR-associated endonuclease/helicase Cas3